MTNRRNAKDRLAGAGASGLLLMTAGLLGVASAGGTARAQAPAAEIRLEPAESEVVAWPREVRMSTGTYLLRPSADSSPDDRTFFLGLQAVALRAKGDYWRLSVIDPGGPEGRRHDGTEGIEAEFVGTGRDDLRTWVVTTRQVHGMREPGGSSLRKADTVQRFLLIVAFDGSGEPAGAAVTNLESRRGVVQVPGAPITATLLDANADGQWCSPQDAWRATAAGDRESDGAWGWLEQAALGLCFRSVDADGRAASLGPCEEPRAPLDCICVCKEWPTPESEPPVTVARPSSEGEIAELAEAWLAAWRATAE